MNLVEYRRRWPSANVRDFINRRWNGHFTRLHRTPEAPSTRSAQKAWGHRMGRALKGPRLEVARLMNAMPTGASCGKAVELLERHNWFVSDYSGRWVHDPDRCAVSGGRYVRSNEIRYYRECRECSIFFRPSQGIQTANTHAHLCSRECAEDYGCYLSGDRWLEDSDDDDDSDNGIYSYATCLGGLIQPGGKYNLGTELEIEFAGCTQLSRFVYDIGKEFRPRIAHCKSDGSLGNYGVEVVTGYGDFAELSEVVGKICEIAASNGGTSHQTTTCGQHISVGRENMSIAQQARFVVFFNHPDNQPLLKEFARRSASSWARVDHYKAMKPWLDSKVSANSLGRGDKYEAVNVNHSTHLEVRIFRGTLRAATAIARMALVQSVATYCEQEMPVEDLVFTKYLEWVNANECDTSTAIKEYMIYRDIKQPSLAV